MREDLNKAFDNENPALGDPEQLGVMKDRVEVLSKLILVGFGISFGSGFVIVNSYRQSMGSSDTTLFQVEYVSAGVLWWFLFLSVVAYVVFWRSIVKQIKPFIGKRERTLSKLILWSLLHLFLIVLGFMVFTFIFGSLSSGAIHLFTIKGFALIFVNLFGSACIWNVYRELRKLYPSKNILVTKSKRAGFTFVDWGLIMGSATFFLICLSTFGKIYYPRFDKAFGGGKPRIIRVAIQPEHDSLLTALGVSVDTQTRLSEPLRLVSETEADYLVKKADTEVGSLSSDLKTPVIMLRKSIVQGAFIGESYTATFSAK